MLKNLTQLSRPTIDANDRCPLCLESPKNDSVFHVSSDGKIQHIASCSFNCLETFFLSSRTKEKEISCPQCLTNITSVNEIKIKSEQDIRLIQKDIIDALSNLNISQLEVKSRELQGQFITGYYFPEMIPDVIFLSINNPAIDAIDALLLDFIKTHSQKVNERPFKLSECLFMASTLTILNSTNRAALDSTDTSLSQKVLKKTWDSFLKLNPNWNDQIQERASLLSKALVDLPVLVQDFDNSLPLILFVAGFMQYLNLNKELSEQFNFDSITLLILKIYYNFHLDREDELKLFLRVIEKNTELLKNAQVPPQSKFHEMILRMAHEKGDVPTVKFLLQNFNYSRGFIKMLLESTQSKPTNTTQLLDQKLQVDNTTIHSLMTLIEKPSTLNKLQKINLAMAALISVTSCLTAGKYIYDIKKQLR